MPIFDITLALLIGYGAFSAITKFISGVKWLLTRQPKKLNPVNVIQGMIFPLPDDPRWVYRTKIAGYHWTEYIYDKIKFDSDWHNRIKVDGEILVGPDVERYLDAVKAAYKLVQQEKANQKASSYLTDLLERDISKDIETDKVDEFKHLFNKT